MAFVFDNRNLKAEFLLVLRSMVKIPSWFIHNQGDYWLTPEGIPFKFKDRDDDTGAGRI